MPEDRDPNARPLRALVVDDEGPARRVLAQLLTRFCEGVSVVGEAASRAEATRLLAAARPDVVFLDVELGEGTGFDLLAETPLGEAQVVFVTAYADYAVRAFRVAATDYLVKPIELAELRASLERVRARAHRAAASRGPTLSVPHANGQRVLPTARIVSVRAEGSYSLLRLAGGETLLVTRKLGVLEAELPAGEFLRVHRSHLVNLAWVKVVRRGDVLLGDGGSVPISRGTAREVVAAWQAAGGAP